MPLTFLDTPISRARSALKSAVARIKIDIAKLRWDLDQTPTIYVPSNDYMNELQFMPSAASNGANRRFSDPSSSFGNYGDHQEVR